MIRTKGQSKRTADIRKKSSLTSSNTNWGKATPSISTSVHRSTSTSISSVLEGESRVIVAMTEGRGDATCEVGLACMDINFPNLILCQISDTHSYVNTLTKINVFNPVEIVVPFTFLECDNRLTVEVKKRFPDVKVTAVSRKVFNKSNGMERILQLCLPSINTICINLQHRYYAVSAASALLTYAENNLGMFYASETVNVSYQESEGYAIIDIATADKLELVSSTKPSQAKRHSSLFGILNNCFTRIGARTLRSRILQPSCSLSYILERQECIAELIDHPEVLLSVQEFLQNIVDVDNLLTISSILPRAAHNYSSKQINYVLLLNGVLDTLSVVKEQLAPLREPFFKYMIDLLQSEQLKNLAHILSLIINSSARMAKNNEGINQRCFAIKSGLNGLLDLVRKTYSERLEDIKAYITRLGKQYGMSLSLGNNYVKGYHIIWTLNAESRATIKTSDMPGIFIQVCRLSRSVTMKTAELINLTTRLEDIITEILKISNVMIHKTLLELKAYIGFFYTLCEAIGKLDELQSLAQAGMERRYVRPTFGELLEIHNARHPLLDLLYEDTIISNPVLASKDLNLHLITGPNGSGKSIYIRQIVLLQVMAQIGCYVPADSAKFRLSDRMLARIYMEDNIEYGVSTFILEMKEIKYMMATLTENSLFIIDELCRSTSLEEGVALAMGICENLCKTSGFIYITTHFPLLSRLCDMYINVTSWHMETLSVGVIPSETSLDFKYTILLGSTTLDHYGVFMVKRIWPDSPVDKTYGILANLENHTQGNNFYGIATAVKSKSKLEYELKLLKAKKQLTRKEVRRLLSDYDLKRMYDKKSDYTHENVQNISEMGDCNTNYELHDISNGKELTNNSNNAMRATFRNDFQNQGEMFNTIVLNTEHVQKSKPNRDEFQTNMNMSDETDFSEFGPTQFCNESNIVCFQSSKGIVDDTLIQEGGLRGVGKELLVMGCNVESNQEVMEKERVATTSSLDNSTHLNFMSAHYANESNMEQHCSQLEIDSQESITYSPFSSPTGSGADITVTTTNKHCTSESNMEANDFHQKISLSQSITYSPCCSPSGNRESIAKLEHSSTIENEKSLRNSNDNSSPGISLEFVDENVYRAQYNSENYIPPIPSNVSCIPYPRRITKRTREKSSECGQQCTSITNYLDCEETNTNITPGQARQCNFKSSIVEPDNKNKNKGKNVCERISYIPPKRYTSHEIENEFLEQYKNYRDNITDAKYSKYIKYIIERPSAKQIQNTKHLAVVRKTTEGYEIIPTPETTNTKTSSTKCSQYNDNSIDVSIFSDKNCKPFEKFINSSKRDLKSWNSSLNLNETSNKCVREYQISFNFNPLGMTSHATEERIPEDLIENEKQISKGSSMFPQVTCDDEISSEPTHDNITNTDNNENYNDNLQM